MPCQIEQPAGTNMFGGVDENIDLAADIGREIRDGFLVADIERHDLDTLQRARRPLAARTAPRSATPTNTIDAPAAFSAATTS